MTKIRELLAREPVRVYLYTVLVALLPLLVAAGVPLTEPLAGAIVAFAYAGLIGGVEAARSKVTPV